MDAAQRSSWEACGWLVVRGAFDRDTALRCVDDHLVPSLPAEALSVRAPSEKWYAIPKDAGSCSCTDLDGFLTSHAPKLKAVLDDLHLEPFRVDGGGVMSVRPARLFDQPRFVLPATARWHVDRDVADRKMSLSCVVLLHFSDTAATGGGGTALIEGSHTLMALAAGLIPTAIRRTSVGYPLVSVLTVCILCIARLGWLARLRLREAAPLRAGDATVMHGHLVHAVTENTRTAPRFVQRFACHRVRQ
jgi:hypothetical protein